MYQYRNYTIDPQRYELRSGGEARHVEPQVFGLIQYLIENRERVVTKDELIAEVWQGRIVSDSTLSSRINAARKALGDDGDAQAVIRTVPRRGFRFVAEVSTIEPPAAAEGGGAPPGEAAAEAPSDALPPQEIRFCTAPDGVALAYAIAGQGYPVVKTANWLSHLEFDWHSPIWRHLLHALVADYRLIRYDQRGNGLSDWNVAEFSFEAFVSDLETVVDAAGLDRFVLFGLSQGCAISAAYAARHPERVSRLVLYGGYTRGWKKSGGPETIEERRAMLALARIGWGRDNPAFRQVFTSQFIPDGTAEEMQWYNELQRISTSGENVVRIVNALGDVDVSDLLPQVTAPALVLHCRDDARAPFDEGRRLATLLPNAKFVALDGRNHLLLETEPAWARFRSEVRSFLHDLT